MGSYWFTRQGVVRGAMQCIGQAPQRRRWADMAHRRPAFGAPWTALDRAYGRLRPPRAICLALRRQKPVKVAPIERDGL